MPKMIRQVLMVGFATLALAACGTTAPMEKQVAVLPPPIGLDVARIEVVSKVQASSTRPHVEGLLPTTPEQALRDWANNRLVAQGQSGVARFTITDAAIVEEDLPRDVGMPGLLRAPQTVRYNATAAAILEVLDEPNAREGRAAARVAFSRTIWPDASPEAHQDLWQGMIAPLVSAFDSEMTENIRGHLGSFIR
ncbi:MAG: hypothetical protein RBS99_06365 [Rhodospirillales bacterium]|jgi:hypothetical protein|nr:hypothetical protein [Rhodospirillales bacterium]